MSGWTTYSARRAMPCGDYRPRRHGNATHGRYAKDANGSRLSIRLVRAMVYGRVTPDLIDMLPRSALGWRLYAHLPASVDRGAQMVFSNRIGLDD